jgi:hypothetical protein
LKMEFNRFCNPATSSKGVRNGTNRVIVVINPPVQILECLGAVFKTAPHNYRRKSASKVAYNLIVNHS